MPAMALRLETRIARQQAALESSSLAIKECEARLIDLRKSSAQMDVEEKTGKPGRK